MGLAGRLVCSIQRSLPGPLRPPPEPFVSVRRRCGTVAAGNTKLLTNAVTRLLSCSTPCRAYDTGTSGCCHQPSASSAFTFPVVVSTNGISLSMYIATALHVAKTIVANHAVRMAHYLETLSPTAREAETKYNDQTPKRCFDSAKLWQPCRRPRPSAERYRDTRC